MSAVRVAVIGGGYWGQNLMRNFAEVPEAELVAVCDLDAMALANAKRRYPTLNVTQQTSDVFGDPGIDAVAIATPVSTHYALAQCALLSGKHVLVEKPLCTRSEDVLRLIELSDKVGRVLMVDHTFLYTGAVRRMQQAALSGEIGEVLYFDSVRVNLGLVQSDTNVLWDLGPHDFSIMDCIFDRDPISVAATGARHFECPFEDLVYVSIRFDSRLIAHFHLNWLAPVKVRRTIVGGSRKLIIYDDMEPSEKVKIYDRGITVTQDPERRSRLLAGYRNGDMVAPNLDTTEALRNMAREFARSIMECRTPLTDGVAAYRVVRLLEAAQQSIENGGHEVALEASACPRSSFAAQAA